MPPVLHDVLRDLIANARKYTPPGGRISAGLHSSEEGLRLVVEDNGLGIPRDELQKVVGFGYRASNVSDKRTLGGGFGLTKALWVAKNFGGRMWVRSRLGVGTRVTLFIPSQTDKTGAQGAVRK
jgi:signal transduction histidine kinase